MANILEQNVYFSPSDINFFVWNQNIFMSCLVFLVITIEIILWNVEDTIGQIRSDFMEFKMQYILSLILGIEK